MRIIRGLFGFSMHMYVSICTSSYLAVGVAVLNRHGRGHAFVGNAVDRRRGQWRVWLSPT